MDNVWVYGLLTSRNTSFLEQYNVVKVLGKGRASDVYLVEDKSTCERYTLKIPLSTTMRMHNKPPALEIKNLMMLVSNKIPHTPQIEYHYMVPHEGGWALVMLLKYISGLPLSRRVKTLKLSGTRCIPEVYCLRIMRILLTVVVKLQKHGIVHRDIKPDNIMISDDSTDLHLIDFGLSTIVAGYPGAPDKWEGHCGTPLYQSPESIENKTELGEGLMASDVYSVGMMICELYYGKKLFQPKDAEGSREHLISLMVDLRKDYQNVLGAMNKGRPLDILLVSMLDPNPSNRISAKQSLSLVELMLSELKCDNDLLLPLPSITEQ